VVCDRRVALHAMAGLVHSVAELRLRLALTDKSGVQRARELVGLKLLSRLWNQLLP
jgi:hypothetical protein